MQPIVNLFRSAVLFIVFLLASTLPAMAQQCEAPKAGNPGAACAGNPINLVTGNKYQREVDLPALPGVLGLEIVRHYNSVFAAPEVPNGLLGRGWRLSYEVELIAVGNTLQLIEADGHRIIFSRDLFNRCMCSSPDPANGAIAISRSARGDEYVWTRNDGQVWRFNSQRKLEQILAPTGEFVSLQHDAAGRLQQVIDPQGRQLKLRYPDRQDARAQGQFTGVQAIDSPAGRFEYRHGNALPAGATLGAAFVVANLASVSAPSGRELRRYHYDDARHPTLLTGISAGQQRISTFGYRDDGRAILSTHANGVDKVTLAYPSPGVTVLTNSLGQITTYRHANIAGEQRLIEARGPGCNLCNRSNLRYDYDHSGREVARTRLDARGVPLEATLTERDYLGRALRVSVVRYADGKPGPAQWQVRYEYAQGQAPTLIARPSVVPGKESVTRIAYNPTGQPLSVIESGWAPAGDDAAPLTRTTRYRYTRINGRSLLTDTDGPLPNGQTGTPADSDITHYRYDPRGSFLVEMVAPGNLATRVTERDAPGRPQKIVTAAGLVFAYDYDLAGRVTRLSRAGLSEFFSYDVLGRLSGVVRPTGERLTMTYGADGRLAGLSDVQGNRVQLQRDTEGQLLARRLLDPDGRVAQESDVSRLDVAADSQAGSPTGDAVTEVNFAAGDAFTRLQYAQDSRLALLTDARNHRTGQVHDDFGRLIRVDSPDGGVTVLAYDAADHLVSKSAGHGSGHEVTMRYSYDVAGRLTGQHTEEGDTVIAYGAQGRPVRITYPAGEEQFDYDAAARLTRHVRRIDGQHVETRYAYDARGQLFRKTLPDGQVLQYRYHGPMHPKAGLLAAITRDDLFGQTVLLDGFNDAGDRYASQHYQLAHGAIFQRQLDPAGRVVRIGSAGYWEEQHQRDALGQLTQRNPTGAGGFQRTGYDYDVAGRMTAVTQDGTNRTYRYDPTGNLLADLRGKLSTGYTIDSASNRIASVEAAGRRLRYDYNSAGSITRIGETAYAWDSQQRLIRVSQRDQPVAEYAYNALGQRIKKISYAGNQKQVTYYFYDGSALVAEAQVSPTERNSGSARARARITRHYVWLDERGSSRPIALLQVRDSGIAALAGTVLASVPTDLTRAVGQASQYDVYAIVADHTGAPRALVNEHRQVVWRASVTGFGELLPDARSVMSLNLRGSNQYYDAETQLHYNHHRYLDPRSGRYLSADPSGLAGGVNLYAFAENNPVANTDPLGLQARPAGDITDWDTQKRVQYVLLRAGGQIPGVIGDALRELVSPAALATTAAVFGIWAGAQAFPVVGVPVDAALIVAGYFIAGTGAVIAAKEIVKAALLTANAKCEVDLQKAGDALASGFVTALGAGAALAGSTQALRTERVQGFLRQVFNKERNGVNGSGSLSGTRTPIPPLSDQATTRSLIRENQSADILSSNGFKVEQNPVVAGGKNPDYRINGMVYDNYAPSTSNVRNIWSTVDGKIKSGQTKNVVINLADSNVDLQYLQSQFLKYPIKGLENIIAIDRIGKIVLIKGN